jgi:hypothetical protein
MMAKDSNRLAKLYDLSRGDTRAERRHNVWPRAPGDASWVLHAPVLPTIDLDRLLELAEVTPFRDLAHLGVAMCRDTNTHAAPGGDDFPLDACPISKVSATDLEIYEQRGYILAVQASEVASWGKLSSIPEPTKDPPRRRPIFDTIKANALLGHAPRVCFTTVQSQLDAVLSAKVAASFDMKGWYFAIPVSPGVSRHMAFRTGPDTWYRWLRGPMGHKWFVFVGHVFTSVLAWIPDAKADIIIDNVLFTDTDEARLQRTMTDFRHRCAYVGATLGQDTGMITTPDHRGIHYDISSKCWGLRESFVSKFRTRVTHALTRPTTAAQWLSIAGSVNWMRQVLDITPLHVWKMAARAAPHNPLKFLAPSQALVIELRYLYAAASKRQTRPLVPSRIAMLVTDAAKTGTVASWGAVLLLPNGVFRTHGGTYCRQASTAHITALELRALWDSIMVFNLQNTSVTWWTDNTAAALVIRGRRTNSYPMWCWLRRIREEVKTRSLSIVAKWLASELNPADGLSRGKALTDDDRQKLMHLARAWEANPWVWEERGLRPTL